MLFLMLIGYFGFFFHKSGQLLRQDSSHHVVSVTRFLHASWDLYQTIPWWKIPIRYQPCLPKRRRTHRGIPNILKRSASNLSRTPYFFRWSTNSPSPCHPSTWVSCTTCWSSIRHILWYATINDLRHRYRPTTRFRIQGMSFIVLRKPQGSRLLQHIQVHHLDTAAIQKNFCPLDPLSTHQK